jgi:tRNA (uracil-5-)-methyltransferase
MSFRNISSYKKGASLIIRESLVPSKEDPSQEEWGTVTDHKGLITTKVGEYRFTFPAGSFFQINTSILPSLIDYVSAQLAKIQPKPRFLLDAYCGSGFFAVGCSSGFEKVVGVDVNQQSIDYATGNAEMNSLENCSFQVGQAEIIFDGLSFTGKDAAVIIDPPRKGCSTDFLEQLVKFSPEGIVYISCNPFSQAKDLTELLKLCKGTGFTYKVDQVRVFDLFPMTMHGEGLVTLIKVKEE